MKDRQQIRFALCGSVLAHLLLAGGVTTILAFNRASPPVNDDFQSASNLYSGEARSGFGDNYYASREALEPAHGQSPSGGSVWWKWNAPQSGEVELNVTAQDFEEVVGVYQGAVLQTLLEVTSRKAGNLDPIRFSVQQGHSYYVAVAGAGEGEEGKLAVNISMLDDASREQDDEQLVLLLPEMFEVEEAKEDDQTEEPAYVRTKPSDAAGEVPDDIRLESDNNTVAASDLLPDEKGKDDTPNVAGEDLPFGELAASEFIDGDFRGEDALPVSADQVAPPDVAPKSPDTHAQSVPGKLAGNPGTEQQENGEVVHDVRDEVRVDGNVAVQEVTGTDEEESIADEKTGEFGQLADVVKEEDKVVDENATEPAPADVAGSSSQQQEVSPPAFRAHAPKKRLEGRLSNIGSAALDVAETPLGHYKKKVDQAVQRSWHRARVARGDFAKFGSLKVRFWVERSGKIVDLKVVRRNADPVMEDFTISGIRSAVLPPVPDELIEKTQDGRMEFDYEIIIY